MYAVKDELTGKFLNPMFVEEDNVALRQFKTSVNRIELWHDNAADYGLYKLGSFDDETGKLEGGIEKLANGRSVVNE